MCLQPHTHPPKLFLHPLADCCAHIFNHLPPPTSPSPDPSKPSCTCNRIVSLSRKVLEQRRKAEEEEERWKEKQKQREKKLQRVVLKRAQANDPHLALSQTHQSKLREFR